MMKYNGYMLWISVLFCSQALGSEVTKGQQAIYAENPHLVQQAGDALNDPKTRAEFIEAMKKASSFTHKAMLGCGAISLACLGLLVRAKSTKGKIASLVAAVTVFALGALLGKVSQVQYQMALNQEAVKVDTTPDASSTKNATDVSDGIYIFSSTNCPPCRLLHKVLSNIKLSFPGVSFFEYDTAADNVTVQSIVRALGINILSIPLTVVVKNGFVAGIISGFHTTEDYLNKLQKIF